MKCSGSFLISDQIKLRLMAFNGNFNITSKPGQVILGIYRACVKSLVKRTSSATKRGWMPQILPEHLSTSILCVCEQ